MLKLRKNKKGFTLVELIVVIAIMAVLAGTVAGVTVSQLNKQTNNTAKSEAKSLASDLHNFMIDYTLPAGTGEGGKTPPVTPGTENTVFTMPNGEDWDSKSIDTVGELTYAVLAFVDENNQGENIKVVSLAANGTVPSNNDQLKVAVTNASFKAGEHKFYAVVYKESVTVTKEDNTTETKIFYKVRFCCLQKGSGNNFPFADYTYSDVLADN